MSKTIYKIPIDLDTSGFHLPGGERVLSVQYQGDQLSLWAECDPEKPPKLVEICVIGTGHPCPDEKFSYFDTVLDPIGPLVWHIYLTEFG